MLKKTYGDDIAVVFIGPCIAKKKESDSHQNLIDVSLTFEELSYWMKEEFITFKEVEIIEEAKAFEEQYKYYFNYRPKSYKTLKITKTFFKGKVECIREWHN